MIYLKKIFPIIFVILFVGVFSYFNGGAFWEKVEKNREIQVQEILTTGLLEEFGLEKIRELDETEFYYTPYKELLSKIVGKINSAQERVYIEVYMLTETRIKESLVKATKRGVDVKVLLEHSPYLAVNLNQKHFKELESNGVNIMWSNPQNFALNHSKLMLIDEEVIISSGNFTYSTFAHNRDVFIFSKDKKIVNVFTQIFLKDFIGEKYQIYDDSLVLSPDYSRDKFEKIVMSATKDIKIYAQYIKDYKLFTLLENKAHSGVNVEIILSKKGYVDYIEENNICSSQELISNTQCNMKQEGSIKVYEMSNKAKMHSKAILVDKKYLFIGSVNFSKSSMDSNREMGVLLSNTEVVRKFLKLFESDK